MNLRNKLLPVLGLSILLFIVIEILIYMAPLNTYVIQIMRLAKISWVVFIGIAIFSILILSGKFITKDISIPKKYIHIVIVFITLVGFILRFYQGDLHDFYEDEFQVIEAANCYKEIGQFCYWDWLSDSPKYLDNSKQLALYARAWPHSLLISLFFRIWGVSEYIARLPSILFGTLLIPLFFYVTRFLFRNLYVALLGAFFIAISPNLIFLSRYTRMYALLIPIFVLQALFAYKLLTSSKINNKSILYGAALLVATVINYFIHVNSLLIGPVFILGSLAALIIRRKRRYMGWLILAATSFIAFWSVSKYYNIAIGSHFLSLFSVRNLVYIKHFFDYPFTDKLGLGFALIGAVYALRFKDLRIIFVSVVTFFSLFFFVFIAARYDQFNYSSHVHVFAVMLSIFGLYILFHLIGKRASLLLGTLLLLVFLLDSLPALSNLYVKHNGRPDYRLAYQEINAEYIPDQDVLWLQFPRTYYLQGLNSPKIIDMGRHNEYSLDQFLLDYEVARSGWIGWATDKSGHVDDQLERFVEENFEKIHGKGIDQSGIEIYKMN